MAAGKLGDPPILQPLRIVPTIFTMTGQEIPTTCGNRVEDTVHVPREIGQTIQQGMQRVTQALRSTNDQHNRIETTEIPKNRNKVDEQITDYFKDIQANINALWGLVGAPNFYPILGISYFGGASAKTDIIHADIEWFTKHRWKHIRVWATWDPNRNGSSAFSAVNYDGSVNRTYMDRLRFLIRFANSCGLSVDVTMGGNYFTNLGAMEAGIQAVCTELGDIKNWFMDLCNEHVGPTGELSAQDARALFDAAQSADAGRALTCSQDGSPSSIASTYKNDYDAGCRYAFMTPHFPRTPTWDVDGAENMNDLIESTTDHGILMRAHMQEESRYGLPTDAVTQLSNFQTSIENARQGGALGVNFHTTAGYDLRTTSFKDQCNDVENDVVKEGIDGYWNEP